MFLFQAIRSYHCRFADKHNIKSSLTLVLENMVHVPKLYTNHVSVNKSSQNLNYKVIFVTSNYDFQD